MLYGVRFFNDDRIDKMKSSLFDTLIDTGFFLLDDVNISAPVLKTKYVDIPGADGTLDFSDAIGDVCYENRTVSFTLCSHADNVHDFEMDRRRLASLLSGRNLRVVLPMDYVITPRIKSVFVHDEESGESVFAGTEILSRDYSSCNIDERRYWLGRVNVGEANYRDKTVRVSVDAFPYKIEWREVSHSFTIGSSGVHSGTLTGSQKVTVPEFTFSDDVSIEFTPCGEELPILVAASAGTYKFPDIRLTRLNDYSQLGQFDQHDPTRKKDPRGHFAGHTWGAVNDHIKFTADEGTEISYRYKRMWL